MKRPRPPKKMLETIAPMFIPALDVEKWVKAGFLNEDSRIYNEHHRHLIFAEIAFLWTNVSNSRQMKTIAATAEIPKPSPMANKWEKAKYDLLMDLWFGPRNFDFLITMNTRILNEVNDRQFTAIIDHELYHCAQKRDQFGVKEFYKNGRPKFAMLGHDVEEFTGIIERYGVQAGAGDTVNFINAAKKRPTVGAVDLKSMCGTCA